VTGHNFDWVAGIPLALCGLGWALIFGAALYALLRRDVKEHDETVRLEAAKELGGRLDRTSSGTAIFWAVDDEREADDDLERERAQFSDQQWWASDEEHRVVPEWIDPPVTRPYATGGVVDPGRPWLTGRWDLP
jgi:hypothetical protein